MDFGITFIEAILTGLGLSVATLLALTVKWIYEIKGFNERRGRQMQVLFQVQIHQIRAQRATLEVVSQKANNGNVDRAFGCLDEAESKMNEHATKEAWK
jgi:hypothetical protein